MATPVTMPRQGQSVETCIITKWFKNQGDHVEKGELLFSYETDKAAFDLESPAEGTLLKIVFAEGEEVPVLTDVAVIGTTGEDIEFLTGNQVTSRLKTGTDHPGSPDTAEPIAQQQVIKTGTPSGKLKISPKARKIAKESGVDIYAINGSGPNGRIISRDIQNLLEKGLPFEKVSDLQGDRSEDKPLTNIRKLIAKSMLSSLQNTAQLTHHMTADVRRILEIRRIIKEKITQGSVKQDITLNDMICWCAIRALEKHRDVNSHFLGDKIRVFGSIHLGIAVDTPRGLMVPTVRHAESMTLGQLSGALRIVADSCRKGSIDPELLRGESATFTVSNLGNYGVEIFTPVLNVPQSAILGVCTIINRPADLGNNTFGFIPVIGLSLTYDHRALDGGPATLFLREIKNQIESFNYIIN
jgi:pyruvate dehydrogenase E2 component (dihydrolipoamide acetyltransferase)